MSNLGSNGLSKRVAIVGAGPLGLIAAKNFVEEGFEVTTFEKGSGVGGLWRLNTDPTQTCVLPGTTTNTSKYTGTMTDFPMPDSYPVYPNGQQIRAYFEAYADKFDLLKHIQFESEVVGISRDKDTAAWRLTVHNANQTATLHFDRLVIATGMFSKKSVPNIPGIDRFQGDMIHSQEFKTPAQLKDKRVLVVGLGSSSVDSISGLLGVGVKKIIVSHRQRPVVLPRITKDHKILELTLTFRLKTLIFRLREIAPTLMAKIFLNELKKIEKDNFPGLLTHRSHAKDLEMPGAQFLLPVVSDDLADNFLSGKLESAPGIQEITGPYSIRFVDGTEAENIDAILLCTGLQPDLAAMVPSAFDPYNPALAVDSFAKLPSQYTEGRRVARLYQGFMSLQSPHQLAFLGVCFAMRPAFQLYDLMTMALAQLWGGNHPMPTPAEMNREADAHIAGLAKLAKKGDVKVTGIMDKKGFDHWLNDVAGTGLYEHLGSWTSATCWKFWWSDRAFYRMLMGGILSTHVLRLFQTGRGRKAWPEAKAAILAANESARRFEQSESQ